MIHWQIHWQILIQIQRKYLSLIGSQMHFESQKKNMCSSQMQVEILSRKFASQMQFVILIHDYYCRFASQMQVEILNRKIVSQKRFAILMRFAILIHDYYCRLNQM
jgi:hypothetical protein